MSRGERERSVPLREYQTNGFFFAAVAVPSGIGIDIGIAVFTCGLYGTAIMLADGFSHPLPNPDIDPLTVPSPVFCLSFIQILPLCPKGITDLLLVYRHMRVDSSGGCPILHYLPRPYAPYRGESPPPATPE